MKLLIYLRNQFPLLRVEEDQTRESGTKKGGATKQRIQTWRTLGEKTSAESPLELFENGGEVGG